jgi:hypothetical protein
LKIDLTGIIAVNEKAGMGARPGLLGECIHEREMATGVLANLDRRGDGASPATLMIADEGGWIDEWQEIPAVAREGVVESAEVRSAVRGMLARSHVVLIDLSPIAELERVDGALVAVADASRDYRLLVFLLAGNLPGHLDHRSRALGPMVVWESEGDRGPGLLASASTRWDGVITAADVAPSLLHWLDPEGWQTPPGMTGRPMRIVAEAGDALVRLDEVDAALRARYRLRFAAVGAYVLYSLLVLLAALVPHVWRARRLTAVGALGLGMALVPVGLLVSPIAGLESTWLHLLAAAAATLLLIRLALSFPSRSAGLAFVTLFGAGLLAADVLLGSGLMRQSALGFGVMLGSRFYGVGNEYAGAVVGMTAVGLGALLQVAPRSKALAVACGTGLVLVIGAPWWGANWGWSFAAACSMVALWLLASARPLPRLVVGGTAVLLAAALLPPLLDLTRSAPERSHIGTTIASLLSQGTAPLADIVRRKAAMQLDTVGQAPWMLAGVVLAAAVWWALLHAEGAGRRALRGRRYLGAGITAAVIAGIVASVVNDSGLVAGSGSLLVATGTLLFLAESHLGDKQ